MIFASSANVSMHCQRCFFHDRYPGAWAWDTCMHPSEGKTTQYILFSFSVGWKNLGAMTWLLGIWKPLVFCVCTHLLFWQVGARSFSGLPSAKHKQSRRFLESIDENFLIQEVEKPMKKVLHLMPTQTFERLWWPGGVPESWNKVNITQSKVKKEDPEVYRSVSLTSIWGQASQSLLRLD